MASRVRGTPRPFASTSPSISGTATLGQVLTCNPGAWQNGATITYQWIRDASTVIAAATSATYTLVAADQTHTVKCRVTGTNGYDAITADTASTGTVA